MPTSVQSICIALSRISLIFSSKHPKWLNLAGCNRKLQLKQNLSLTKPKVNLSPIILLFTLTSHPFFSFYRIFSFFISPFIKSLFICFKFLSFSCSDTTTSLYLILVTLLQFNFFLKPHLILSDSKPTYLR